MQAIRNPLLCLLAALALAASAASGAKEPAKPAAKAPMKLKLSGVEYVHRWSKGGQNEFTPVSQTDLKTWRDMVSVVVNGQGHTGDQLATLANDIVGNYSKAGEIIRTDSKPRTASARPSISLPQCCTGRGSPKRCSRACSCTKAGARSWSIRTAPTANASAGCHRQLHGPQRPGNRARGDGLGRDADTGGPAGPAAATLRRPMGTGYLPHYRDKLLQVGADPAPVDALVEEILASPEEFARLAPQVREAGNALPWYYDQDYAAVALQAAAGRSPDPALRRKLLTLAHDRAIWCASCSTSGGEGTARSRHVQELEACSRRRAEELTDWPATSTRNGVIEFGDLLFPGERNEMSLLLPLA
jgi:hypothetical protein